MSFASTTHGDNQRRETAEKTYEPRRLGISSRRITNSSNFEAVLSDMTVYRAGRVRNLTRPFVVFRLWAGEIPYPPLNY